MDAIRNCQRILRQWGVIDMYTDKRERRLRVCEPYRNANALQSICNNIYKFNMDTPLLQ